MPSIRRQMAKTRKSRVMDMMSDFENMDKIHRNENTNPIERDLSDVIGTQKTIATMSQIHSLEKIILREMEVEFQDRLQETMETFTSEINMDLSQEMDSIMSMMHTQIIRAKNLANAERVIPEFQNNVSSMSSSGNRNTESGLCYRSERQQGP